MSAATDLPDETADPRHTWATQQGVLEGEVAQFQVMAVRDPEAAVQLHAASSQLRALSQRLDIHDDKRLATLERKRETRIRRQKMVGYCVVLMVAFLAAMAIWHLVRS